MEVARSIYWGGQIIEAKDKSLNYFSYKELGLICPICGEEVHLRKGQIMKPHFAHFQLTEVSKNCRFRVKNYSTNFNKGWQYLIHGKEQRRQLFKRRLLKLIIDDLTLSSSITLNQNLITNLLSELRSDKANIVKYVFKNKDSNTENFILECQIIFEVIDYLRLDTSHSVLEQIIKHIVFDKNSDLVNVTDILELLIKIDWSQKIYGRDFSNSSYNLNIVKRTKIGRIKSDLVDDFSQPFEIELTKQDHRFGLSSETPYQFKVQIKNERIYLYVIDGFKLRPMCELATLDCFKVPTYQWIATEERYQSIADTLNKGRKIKTSGYKGLKVTQDKVLVGKRVLATREDIGNSLQMVSILNPEFIQNEKVLPEYKWLDALRLKIHEKIVQPNAKIIYKRNNFVKISNRDIKKLINTTRKLLSRLTGIDQQDLYCCIVGTSLVEDAVEQGLNKEQYLDWLIPIKKLPISQAKPIVKAKLNKLGLDLPE